LWQNLSADEQYGLALLDGPVDIMRSLEQMSLIRCLDGSCAYTSEIVGQFVRRQQVHNLLQGGPFVIDPQRHVALADGRPLELTGSQFALLSRLCQEPGQVITAENLALAVWEGTVGDDPDRLKTLVKRLRRAIEPYGNWISSERGIGYALRRPENELH
jgi:DNA-binding response OmpR family regulator